MQTKRFSLVRFLWMMVALAVVGLFQTVLAQVTNGTTPVPPPIDPLNPFPAGKEAIWLALVPPITFTITWLFGKIPPLPKEILPWITPVIGVIIGAVMNWATTANLPWWSTAGAGAIAVALYEAAKNMTKAGPESALTPTPKPPFR